MLSFSLLRVSPIGYANKICMPSCHHALPKTLSNRAGKWATLFAFEEREVAKISIRHPRM
jgi:hypothetical protein